MVLFAGHGEWILGGRDDRTSKIDLCVYHAVRSVRMVADAFGLKNAPQIYQCLIDNALYGYLKIGVGNDVNATDHPKSTDVFTEGEPETDQALSCWAGDLILTTY